jgi:hypothetical protein
MMSLGLKILLTPALIALASLVGRRWGPTVSGWLVGLPFTSGPVAFFLALDHGSTFAAAAATGTLAGAISEVGFCLAYAACAGWWSFSWQVAFPASICAFVVSTFLLTRVSLPALPLYVVVVAVLALALVLLRLIQSSPSDTSSSEKGKPVAELRSPPAWDLPARMVLATVFVVALTAVAPVVGPRLAGLLAPFPLYASILVIFAHQQQGRVAADGVLRGLLVGQFAFTSFFLVLAVLLPRTDIILAFAGAIAVTLAVEGISLLQITGKPSPTGLPVPSSSARVRDRA